MSANEIFFDMVTGSMEASQWTQNFIPRRKKIENLKDETKQKRKKVRSTRSWDSTGRVQSRGPRRVVFKGAGDSGSRVML